MTATMSHDRANEILPWYANGTLAPAERVEVEGHLAGCAVCRRELESLRIVGAAAAEEFDALPAARKSSLASMLHAIDEVDARKEPGVGRSLAAWLETLWTPSVATARFAMVLQFLLIAALGIALVVSRREPSFSTLSGSPGASAGVRINIAFLPGATSEAMNRALRDNGARIVAGPSSLGVYTMQLAVTDPADPQVGATIESLRQLTEVVRFVELEP